MSASLLLTLLVVTQVEPPVTERQSVLDERAERIVQQMQSAKERLAGNDAGSKTQDIQKQILADLDELLKSPPQKNPNQNSGGGQGGSSSQSAGQSGSKPQSESSRPEQMPQGTASDPAETRPAGSQRNREQAQDSTERTGPARAAEVAAARRRRLEVDIWGHLPEQLREQLLNTYGEKMVPQYEDMVRKFYEALLEPPERARR